MIYGFRNADHTIISRFNTDFPAARVIELDTNYRSRQPILDAAYAIIRHSKAVAPMALRAASPARRGERSLSTPEGIEEERRLCYVALTRAGERLHLSWASGRNRGQQLKPSRFLGEIEAYGRERMGR